MPNDADVRLAGRDRRVLIDHLRPAIVEQLPDHGGSIVAVARHHPKQPPELALENEEAFIFSPGVRTRYFLPSWRSTFRKYGRVVLGVMPKGWEFLREALPSDSQSSQIEELTQLFARLPLRVVFLLDEIDRMHEEELTVLLKILRGAPELSNVSYICAFNKEALAKVVAPLDSQFGCRYLDKFFPVQVPLPRIDADLRERLFSERLSSLLEQENVLRSVTVARQFSDMSNSLWYDALETRLTNFRSIGQLLRGFHNSLHVLKEEVDAFDLLVIESLRMQLPSTYEFVYHNGRFFHDPPGGIERWNRSPHFQIDDEARKKEASAALDEYFSELTAADRELAKALLVRMFPSVKAYFREKSIGSFLIETRDRERRISEANYFSRYFVSAVPETMFGEKEMDEFIASIRSADEQKIAATFDATLPGTEPNDLRRIHFLRRLEARVVEIPDRQARCLAMVMAQRTEGMLSDHIAYLVIKALVLSAAARFQRTPELQGFLEEVVQKAASDRFASDIVYSAVSDKDSDVHGVTNWKGFDDEKMKRVFGERMRLRHPKPVTQILPSNGDDPMAFSRWRFYVPSDAPYMTEFFRTAFDFDIKNLGVFLRWLLPGNVQYQGGAIKFIESFYVPISDIVARLKKAEDDKVQWDPELSAAIDRFHGFLAGGESDPAHEGTSPPD